MIIILVIAALSISSTDACVENNIDYHGNDIVHGHNIASWEACSNQCRTLPACKGWTWLSDVYTGDGRRKDCYLKNSNWRKGRRELSGVISGSRHCGDPCAENNMDYHGNDITHSKNIASWEDCSSQCRTLPACQAWTWLSENYRIQERRGDCYLKNSNWKKGKRTVSGVISGSRRCADPCAENNMDYHGNDITHSKNIPSWEECSDQCRTIPACQAWTWLSENYADKVRRKDCYLKNSNWRRGRRSFSGVISGSRRCGD